MNVPQIPADLADEFATLHAEQQAHQRLRDQEQQRLDRTKRLRDSLKSLAGNADFEFWMSDYLKTDIALKLQQLATCPSADLPLARQRWLDAKEMLDDLQAAITDARTSPEN